MNKNKFKILFILILSIFGINNVYALPDDSSLTDETNNPIAEEENLSTELYTNPNTGYQLIIEDDANLLSDFEEEKLRKEMQPLTEYGNIAFKSTEVSSYSTSAFSDSYYHDKFGTASGTVFVVDMRRRQIYIFSDGANYETITNGKADIITDNIYTYASEGDYYKCASVAYEQMYTILNGGKIAEPMRYISNTLIALTAAFLINFIIVLISTGIRKSANHEVIASCTVDFNIGEIIANKTGSHRVYSPQSSSSGGGSSGGGGGGGGSSGGGGGHSF